MELQSKVTKKENLTHKIIDLHLKLEGRLDFKPGQFVRFIVNEKDKKPYSITTLPKDSENLGFCIDIAPGGVGSKFVIDLNEGDEFKIEAPFGVFTVNDLSKDLIFVATGAGVAPFKSMIVDALEKGASGTVELVFGVRNEQDIFWFDFFNDLQSKYPNFKFTPCLSQPQNEWNGFTGRVTSYLENYDFSNVESLYYICGGPEMIKSVRTLLMQKGVPVKNIKIEVFT